MRWTSEAEAAIKKVPFFVRNRVRTRVEKEAFESGKKIISIHEINATKKRYLSGMESEIKGYQLDTCFGPSGCPNRTNISDELLKQIETQLKEADLFGFLKQRVDGGLKFHHELRVTLADCPNACSQPQIKDIGIIGTCIPRATDEPCSLCEACVEACREDAVSLDTEAQRPQIHHARCVGCGQCIQVCPTGTLAEGRKGYRVQLGGKLGRHPRLARELPDTFNEDQVLQIVEACITFYKQNSRHGERFAELLAETDFDELALRFTKKGPSIAADPN